MDPSETQAFLISDRASYLARVHVGVTIPVFALALLPFCARIYIRIRPVWRMGWDDAFVIVGMTFAISSWALLQFEMFMKPKLVNFPEAENFMKLSYIAIPVWGAAMTCIKMSAALTLLRIPLNVWWRVFLYIIAGLQIVYFIGNTVFVFVTCIPLKAIWDFSVAATAKCVPQQSSHIASNIGSAINITTDILLSLAPMVILWNIRRPLRERILVCVLTGIGILASISSVVKAVMVRQWGEPGVDACAVAVSIATWTILEQFFAVMATCSPALKGPLQRALKSVGIFITSYNSHVSFIEVRRSKLAAALTKEEKDDCGDGRLQSPSPAHFRTEGAIKTHFTMSMTRSQTDSDLEAGYSGGSDAANQPRASSSEEQEKEVDDHVQTVAPTTTPQ